MTDDPFELSDKMRELDRKRQDALSEVGELIDKDGPGYEERTKRLYKQVDRLNEEYADLRQKWSDAVAEGVRTGRFATEPGDDRRIDDSGPTLARGRHRDPWGEARTSARSLMPVDQRSLALSAVERAEDAPDEGRERVTQLIESDTTGKAASWALASSDPSYRTAFRKLLKDPANGHREFSGDELAAFQRAAEEVRAMSLTDNVGGYMVPFSLDPNVVITNAGVIDPMRQISRSVTIATDTWNGVTSAGVSAEWIAEATEVADASPTLAQPSITVHKADVFIPYSVELEGDAVALEQELQKLMLDAKQRLEAGAFITGSGSGQPFGLMSRLSVTTASRVAGSSGAAGAATLTAADVYALAKALPPRHQPNASWLTNYATGYDIRQLATGTGPQHAFWADLGAATPPQLLGRPFYQSSEIDATVISGSNDDVLVVGDFKNYVIVDRVGTTVELIPHLLGSNRRPTLQRGLVMWWRVGGDALNYDAWRYLRI